MKNKEIYWSVGTFLTTILVTGLIFDFNYFDEVDVQLHDTYIVVLPFYFSLIFWIVLTFLIFLIRGFKNRFLNKVSTWILLVANSLMIVFTSMIAYAVYAFFSLDVLADLFKESKRIDVISEQFNIATTICFVLIVLFSIGEVFLIRRLIKG